MAIHFEHGIEVGSAPTQVFAILDDVAQTPRWLARCTGIEKLSPGPNEVGTKLRYGYREGRRTGTMEGAITSRRPDERLTFRYLDKMMEVVVDFRVSQADGGTRLVHAIDITPRTFMAKLFAPLIRRQLPKQTITAMTALKRLVEQGT